MKLHTAIAALLMGVAFQSAAAPDDDIASEYKTLNFVGKELQLVIQTKCKISIPVVDLIRESSAFKKLATMKLMYFSKKNYDSVLYNIPCPLKPIASDVKP
ncbi:MAG: hypothetical protein ACI936_001722 [Paraglaciecola sp.]|jgi:hypothetical protein